MTNQEKKQYLLSYGELNDSINQKLDELTQLNALATKVTTTMSDMPKAPTKQNTREDTYIKLIMLENEINTDIDRYVDTRRNIEDAIRKVGDATLQNVLRYKYINGLAWEQIAVKMMFSYFYVVKELHSQALTEFKIPQTTPR